MNKVYIATLTITRYTRSGVKVAKKQMFAGDTHDAAEDKVMDAMHELSIGECGGDHEAAYSWMERNCAYSVAVLEV